MKVLALGRSKIPPKELLKFAEYQSIDFTKKIPKLKAGIVIHCAGQASEKDSLDSLISHNLCGTENLFNAIETEHFIHISSASVYPSSIIPHKENEVLYETQLSNYGISKLRTDLWLQTQISSEKKITIIRPRAVYGVGDRMLLPKLMQLVKGRYLIMPGALEHQISITNIKNLIHATEAVSADSNYQFEIFNVADNETYQLGDLIKTLMETTYGRKLTQIKISPSILMSIGKLFGIKNLSPEVFKFFLRDQVISSQKVQQHFNLKLEHNFVEFAPELVEWKSRVGVENLRKGLKNLPWL